MYQLIKFIFIALLLHTVSADDKGMDNGIPIGINGF
jgi:hypothetical protein